MLVRVSGQMLMLGKGSTTKNPQIIHFMWIRGTYHTGDNPYIDPHFLNQFAMLQE